MYNPIPENLNEKLNFKKENIKTIYFAGGCFWGVELYISRILGVCKTKVGYANGKIKNPSYEEVCSLDTEHTEAVEVKYDSSILDLKNLLEEFFKIIDPIAINRQGPDIGDQYRTGIYYLNDEDKELIEDFIKNKQNDFSEKIATEVLPLKCFYKAEEYHQKYLEKNPFGYCHIDMSELPNQEEKLKDLDYSDKLKKLSNIEYDVTQNNGTERPFTGKYNDFNEKGLYIDIVSGEPLFLSSDKFKSNCGWPAFSKAIDDNIIKKEDNSYGMDRIEVRSKRADSHLGHLFDDGPKKLGGNRYCINSAALKFIPFENLEKEGYGDYIDLF
ncbi:MAG: peptide-methionine (S)-S-oxide reductase MsrA [Methanobacteriaceae archaeon]|jgi:peptide methionine sulfoxide reductase msrA/msrB|nr:peptide-methionine (S)-S-oxide reductase MsrA [Methanobacteriaceae archaeon]